MLRPTVFIALAMLLAICPTTAVASDAWTERAELDARYAEDLEKLAAWCDENSLTTEAAQTREWARPRDPYKLYVVVLSEGIHPPHSDADPKTPAGQWNKRFTDLRQRKAEQTMELARRAIRQGFVSLAYELVLATAHEDPDQEAARRLLGYQRYQQQWRTTYEIRKLRAGQVWSDKFGWLPAAHLPRYEAGERFVSGRWVTAEEDVQLHQDIQKGWEIETEHYRVTTNHSLEAGVQLGIRLERLYSVWRQTFARYYASEAQIARMFEGRAMQRASGPRHHVVYFRNRDEYNQALARTITADIRITTGIYLAGQRQAFFFAGDDQDDGTLYHEATHQLFSESRAVVASPGAAANFWIVEGIACYMESLARQGDYYALGGFDAVRLKDARYRWEESKFYVPLERLTAYGMLNLQHDPDIAKLYSQSAGLTHFLMHANGGRYRDALIEYLLQVYTGRDTPATLSQLTRLRYSELDRRYQQFLSTEAASITKAAQTQGG